MNNQKGLIALSFSLLTLLAPRPAAAKSAFYFAVKANFIQASGSSANYIPGREDFCLASAHQTYGAVMGLRLGLGRVFFIEFEGQYNGAGNATLTDPSDQDTVKVRTYADIAGLGFLGIKVFQSAAFDLSLIGGGGVFQLLSPVTGNYTSTGGYETIIEAPRKKTRTAYSGGIVMHIFFSGKTGFVFSGRFTSISLDRPKKSVDMLFGLVFAF